MSADADDLEAHPAAWVDGMDDELRFWEGWLAGRGLQWADDYERRLDPDAPLEPRVAEAVRGLAGGGRFRILDVGAGPVTDLGYKLAGFDLGIEATDPLAPFYAALLARHGVAPPVATRFAPAEDLCLFVPEAGYDLVHCRNALDHSLDPVRGIGQMLAAARVGGAVLLCHFADESTPKGGFGLHRWNLALRDGGTRFVVWDRSGEVDVATALRCPCRITCRDHAGWVDVLIEKTGTVPAEPVDAMRRRFAAWVEASVRLLGRGASPPPMTA